MNSHTVLKLALSNFLIAEKLSVAAAPRCSALLCSTAIPRVVSKTAYLDCSSFTKIKQIHFVSSFLYFVLIVQFKRCRPCFLLPISSSSLPISS